MMFEIIGPCRSRANDPRRHLVFSRAAMREVDRAAIEEHGIPGIVLMENAATALLAGALELLEGVEHPSALICCGPGNNGGDGLALARRLQNEGVRTACLLSRTAEAYTGDARVNLQIAESMCLRISVADGAAPEETAAQLAHELGGPALIVDALFGTGLTRAIEAPTDRLIEWINRARSGGAKTLAVDIPSGLDTDSGEPLGPAVRADLTVTLGGMKQGLAREGARAWTGRIEVGDIGAPIELLEAHGRTP